MKRWNISFTLFFRNADTRIPDKKLQQALPLVIFITNRYSSLLRKLHGVVHQIGQHLHQTVFGNDSITFHQTFAGDNLHILISVRHPGRRRNLVDNMVYTSPRFVKVERFRINHCQVENIVNQFQQQRVVTFDNPDILLLFPLLSQR